MSRATDEALARIEHKTDITLDLVMEIVGRVYGIKANAIPKMGEGSHQCPVCKAYVKYVIDPHERTVSRQCKCETGKFAPLDLDQFSPPPAAGGKRHGEESGYDATGERDAAGGEQRGSQGSRRR